MGWSEPFGKGSGWIVVEVYNAVGKVEGVVVRVGGEAWGDVNLVPVQ